MSWKVEGSLSRTVPSSPCLFVTGSISDLVVWLCTPSPFDPLTAEAKVSSSKVMKRAALQVK